MDEAGYVRAIADAGLPKDLSWRVAVSSRRRTVGLIAEPGGSLTIRVPEGTPADHVTDTVVRRLSWIARATGRRAELAAVHPVKELIDGENFPFLGRNRQLILDAPDDDVRLEGDRLIAPARSAGLTSKHLIRWYAGAGLDWLIERVPQWCARIGAPPSVTSDVRDLGKRWGTCTNGTTPQIALHWALFQLFPRLIDVVIVHELAHLVEPKHGGKFDQLVEGVMPDYRDRLAEVAESGRRVWMGAVGAASVVRP